MPQPNLKSEDYYEILGCPRNVDDAQLKKAYRKLAVKVRCNTIESILTIFVVGLSLIMGYRGD